MTQLQIPSTTRPFSRQISHQTSLSFGLEFLNLPSNRHVRNSCEVVQFGAFQRLNPSSLMNLTLNISNKGDVAEETAAMMRDLVGDGLLVVKAGGHEIAFVPPFSEVDIFTYVYCGKVHFFDSYQTFRKFLKHENLPVALDDRYISQSIASDRIRSRATAFKNLQELQHGSSLAIFEGRECVSINHLPSLVASLAPLDISKEEAIESVRNLLFEAIRAKSGSGRIGFSASGGFDSSLISTAFSVAAPEHKVWLYHLYSSKVRGLNEIEYFNDLRLRLRHEARWLDAEDGRDHKLDFPNMVPGFRPPPVSGWYERNWMLYNAAKADGIQTLLSGDGGDQLMLVLEDMSLSREFRAEGYPVFKSVVAEALLRQTSIWDVIRSAITRRDDRLTIEWAKYDSDSISPVSYLMKNTEHMSELIMTDIDKLAGLSVSRLFQISTLNDARYNNLASALGVCERKPFIYWPLIKFCLSCPRNIMFSGGRERGLFRLAFADLMPRSVANRIGKVGDVDVPNLFDFRAVRDKLINSGRLEAFLDLDRLRNINTNALSENVAKLLMRAAAVDAYLESI